MEPQLRGPLHLQLCVTFCFQHCRRACHGARLLLATEPLRTTPCRRLDCILLTYLEALSARPAAMAADDVVQPRLLALSTCCDWPAEAAAADLLLADGCRGARALVQTVADALVS